MKTVNIQFHMLFDELLNFVTYVRDLYQLDVELEHWHPARTKLVDQTTSLAAACKGFGQVDRIWLIYKPERSKTAERFMLNVGTVRERRLKQADLGAGARTAEGAKVLDKITRELKRRTTAGVWVADDLGGSAGFAKSFRISPGAAHASRSGVLELVGIGFTQTFYPDDPSLH